MFCDARRAARACGCSHMHMHTHLAHAVVPVHASISCPSTTHDPLQPYLIRSDRVTRTLFPPSSIPPFLLFFTRLLFIMSMSAPPHDSAAGLRRLFSVPPFLFFLLFSSHLFFFSLLFFTARFAACAPVYAPSCALCAAFLSIFPFHTPHFISHFPLSIHPPSSRATTRAAPCRISHREAQSASARSSSALISSDYFHFLFTFLLSRVRLPPLALLVPVPVRVPVPDRVAHTPSPLFGLPRALCSWLSFPPFFLPLRLPHFALCLSRPSVGCRLPSVVESTLFGCFAPFFGWVPLWVLGFGFWIGPLSSSPLFSTLRYTPLARPLFRFSLDRLLKSTPFSFTLVLSFGYGRAEPGRFDPRSHLARLGRSPAHLAGGRRVGRRHISYLVGVALLWTGRN